jgi:hypothetical protein
MDLSSIEEDQVVHDATQVVGNSGASPTMMGLQGECIVGVPKRNVSN